MNNEIVMCDQRFITVYKIQIALTVLVKTTYYDVSKKLSVLLISILDQGGQ